MGRGAEDNKEEERQVCEEKKSIYEREGKRKKYVKDRRMWRAILRDGE